MAGKSKFTALVKGRLSEALRLGSTRKMACAYAGIAYSTLNYWIKEERRDGRKYRGINQLVIEAEAVAGQVHMRAIHEAAEKGDWRASAWWLERRHYHDYGKRMALENEITATITVKQQNEALRERLDSMTDAQLLAIAQGDHNREGVE